MLAADRYDAADRLNQAALERARQRSLRLSTVTFSWTAAMIAHRRGSLPAAHHGRCSLHDHRPFGERSVPARAQDGAELVAKPDGLI